MAATMYFIPVENVQHPETQETILHSGWPYQFWDFVKICEDVGIDSVPGYWCNGLHACCVTHAYVRENSKE